MKSMRLGEEIVRGGQMRYYRKGIITEYWIFRQDETGSQKGKTFAFRWFCSALFLCAKAKAKANAAQGIREMLEIASDRVFRRNHKEKHSDSAANGWYYYTTRFAVPVYDNDVKTEIYNIYSGCLVVNCTGTGKMYLYDLVDIKKEASNPLKTNR